MNKKKPCEGFDVKDLTNLMRRDIVEGIK